MSEVITVSEELLPLISQVLKQWKQKDSNPRPRGQKSCKGCYHWKESYGREGLSPGCVFSIECVNSENKPDYFPISSVKENPKL